LKQAPPRSRLAVSALLVKALGLESTQKSKEAVEVYEQAIGIQPDDVQALNNIAYVLADRLNEPQKALRSRVSPSISTVAT
jgi:Tfp pilus assembly protein PilF